MQSALDITARKIALLKTLELDEICETIANIVTSELNPKAVGVLLWDQDFESFSEEYKFAHGALSENMLELLESLASGEFDWDFGMANAIEMNGRLAGVEPAVELLPVLCYKVEQDGRRVGIVLAGGDSAASARDLDNLLAQFPLFHALANGYETSELRREVQRVREQYEQLEADYHEEKRVNSSQGHQHSSIRMEQTDKERLVYEISNAVRSSLDTQDVLNTAVSKIGKAFLLSRCMVIWPMPDSDEYTIYEYFDESVAPTKDRFFTPQGMSFVRISSSKTAPHDFCDESEHEVFDQDFLRGFGFLSGMLVPLICRDRNIGSLFLQDCNVPREWSIDNTALIGSLADLIAVAIENANLHEEKKRQAVTDGLTGISNRRHFNETFTREFERAKRYGSALSLVVVDLDYLKKINDTFGHGVGDEAIKSIGLVLSKSCRAVDTAARFGGEEFCLLLPDTDEQDAMRLAERVRKLINETHIEGPGYISASIGVATYPHHANEQEELFEAADQALYAAKQSGRNRVCAASSEAL